MSRSHEERDTADGRVARSELRLPRRHLRGCGCAARRADRPQRATDVPRTGGLGARRPRDGRALRAQRGTAPRDPGGAAWRARRTGRGRSRATTCCTRSGCWRPCSTWQRRSRRRSAAAGGRSPKQPCLRLRDSDMTRMAMLRSPHRAPARRFVPNRHGSVSETETWPLLLPRALLARVEEVLRVEGSLDRLVEVERGIRPLQAQAAAFDPADAVLAADLPPRRAASSNSSSDAAWARATSSASRGSTRKVEWRLPSPAWPQAQASSRWRRPIACVSSTASARRSTGTAMSSGPLAAAVRLDAERTPSRQRQSSAVSDCVAGVQTA